MDLSVQGRKKPQTSEQIFSDPVAALATCLKCTTCNFLFKSKQDLERHITVVHIQGIRPFQCNICPSSFPEIDELKSHTASVHKKCDVCHSLFRNKVDLKGHIASVHERKRPFQCNICDATFVGKGDLNRHVASVHEKKKPFQCSICDSAFAENAKLKRHIAAVHERKKPF